jgi:uncharacterized membrane protein
VAKKGHKRLVQNLLFMIGLLFIISPILLYLFIRNNYERYEWIIHQPVPFHYFGGRQFQMWMDIVLVLIGFILIILSIRLKCKNKK